MNTRFILYRVLDNSTINNITLMDVVNDHQLKIGYASSGGNGGWYRFNGDLDDFIIYNRALTQDEITNLHFIRKNYEWQSVPFVNPKVQT